MEEYLEANYVPPLFDCSLVTSGKFWQTVLILHKLKQGNYFHITYRCIRATPAH